MKAISQTSAGKAPGKDGLPVALYKATRPETLQALHDISSSISET